MAILRKIEIRDSYGKTFVIPAKAGIHFAPAIDRLGTARASHVVISA
jgi:hypothetical protein